jgi:hypothetical protein
MIGRSRWAALWLIMPIYNMVVSWKWANEALVFVVFITPRAKEEHIAQTEKDLKMYEMMDVENVVIKSSCERNGEKIPLKDAKNPICDEFKEIKPFHCSYAPL